jgi:Second Messenger Oligonucleotide or Dinucleotide Synthetase domain/Adenylyl/Guanylyl and SMODS C-terminal sensor domain
VKLIEHFNEFLAETVNLNQDRIDTLEDRVETIQEFLLNSEYEPPIRSFSAQGSWAHKTIIRPVDDKEFDADLVVYVDPVDGWDPRDYIIELRRVFWSTDRYRDKASMRTRCVTLNYAGDFHLDVVPVVVGTEFPSNASTYSVCNRTEDEFEPTDGDGYAEWWRGQDALTGGQLKKVTRLLKYLRDVKKTFSVKSVLFTTLIGEQVTALDQLLPGKFVDLPTALKTVVGRLDDWLREHRNMPEVENPALEGESFTRNWTQDQYEEFREKIQGYREWIDEACDEEDRDESIRKWRRVFGDEFAQGETVERATSVVAKLAESFQRGQDLVAVVVAYGRAVLTRMPRSLPHVEAPPYRPANAQVPVQLIAHEKRTKGGSRVRELQSGDLIEPKSGIEFQAVQNNGLPFPKEFEIRWQVVNTDKAATADNGLRGGFYPSDTHGYRYEATKYRGVHWVQAFLVSKRTDSLAGVSDRFFVVIE